MPKAPPPQKPKKTKFAPEEERFLRAMVRLGGGEEQVVLATRQARLKPGAGAKLLKLKRVQAELAARMEPIRLAAAAQPMVSAAVGAALEENAALKEQNAQLAKVYEFCDPAALEREIMRVAMGLNEATHAEAKLAYLTTGLVVSGRMEKGTTRRVAPMDAPETGRAAGVYSSVFDRQRAAETAVLETVQGDDGVYDLVPGAVPQSPVTAPTNPDKPAEVQLPPSGEAIDEVAPAAVVKPSVKDATAVLTVEVG